MFNSHLTNLSEESNQGLNTPRKNEFAKESGTPPHRSHFDHYSNESVSQILKAPAKKNAKGLKILDNISHQFTSNRTAHFSEQSYESEGEQTSNNVRHFREDSVSDLRLPKRAKNKAKPFEYENSFLEEKLTDSVKDDPFKMTEEQNNDVTASLFLFKDDADSFGGGSNRSIYEEERQEFPQVSQFSPCNKKQKESGCKQGDKQMDLLESKINNIQFDDLID